MNAQLEMIPGTNRDHSKSQFFTPPLLAAKLVEWAIEGSITVPGHRAKGLRVLEPSAGNGAIVRPLVAAGAEVYAIELDSRYSRELHEAGAHAIWWDNFLEFRPYEPGTACRAFDLCVMNPPYEDGKDVQFILHALEFAPRVVGIFQADIEYGVNRYDALWKHVRPTRIMKLKRRWFKDAQTGKGGETNYVALELVKRASPLFTFPDHVSLEWW